jgi:Rieske 2Fe-2S family protein
MANGRMETRTQGTVDVSCAASARFTPEPAPPERADLERDLATIRVPLEESTTLPGRLYRDPAIFALEVERIFTKMWLCIGRDEDVANPGDYLTRTIGSDSVIVMRDADGKINAFHNVCRHRGSRLLTEPCGGGLSRLRCPYHAWTYELNGALRSAPHMEDSRNFDKAAFSLNRVRLDTWDGFLFINFSPDGPGLVEHLAEMGSKFAHYRMGTLKRGKRLTYTVQANWKILAENYSECYHCSLIHPELNKVSHYMSGQTDLVNRAAVGGWMDLRKDEYQTMTLSGQTQRPPLPWLPADEYRKIHYYIVYPNLLLSLHPDYVMTHQVWPVAPDRCEIVNDYLFDPAEVTKAGFDPSDASDFWDLTNKQDWKACELTQQGIGSGGYDRGRLSSLEWMVHIFDNFVADRLIGKPAPLPASRQTP